MKRRKRKIWQPVVIGFGVMYLVTMLLATYLVKEKFADEYDNELKQYATAVLGRASNREFDMTDDADGGKNWEQGARNRFYQELSSEYLWMIDNEYAGVSAAFYDKEKNLLAKSRNEIRVSLRTNTFDSADTGYLSFGLNDYLSPEETRELAAFEEENVLARIVPNPYRFYIRFSPDERELWGMIVQELTWNEAPPEGVGRELQYTDPLTGMVHYSDVNISDISVDFATGEPYGETKSYYESDSQIVWEWKNPIVEAGQEENGTVMEADVIFPYLNPYYRSDDVYERWTRWNDSEYLQDFPDQEEFTWESGQEEPPLEVERDGFFYRTRYRLKNGMADDPFGYVEIRMEATPWLEAMDYMKYIYLAGLALTVTCIVKVIYVFRQTNKKQAELEETRRDFINAMAHEMKTPLGVIRNFAENLMEHNMEEKRDYYLAQIISQTEEMDGLVTEMIGISKLDSERLELRKEEVSFAELIREQMDRFRSIIEEKDLQVRYEEKMDFLVCGDREYLARAIWNLLSNAVDYNIPGGGILVRTEGERCVIENTGFPMGEEQLAHAFDLFYTEDKNRSGKDRHMGMGLFLAKKILDIHGLALALENTGDGVRAVIKKK